MFKRVLSYILVGCPWNPVEAKERKESGSRSQETKNTRMTINFAIFPCPNLLGLLVCLSRNKSQIIGEGEFSVAISCGSNHKMTGLYDDLSDTTNTKLYGYFSEKKKLGGMWFLNVRCFYCFGIASVLTWCVVTQLNRINMYSVAPKECHVSFSLRMRSNRIRFL